MKPRYTPETARAMWELRMEGRTLEEVARAFGVSDSTVWSWVDRWVRYGRSS